MWPRCKSASLPKWGFSNAVGSSKLNEIVVWFVFGKEGLWAQSGDEGDSSVSGQGPPEVSGPTFLDQHLDWFDHDFA